MALLRTQLHKAFAVILVIAFLLCAVVPFMPEHLEDAVLFVTLAGNGLAIGVFSLLAFCCMLPMEKPRLKLFSIIGVSVCTLSMLYVLYRSWFGFDHNANAMSGGIYGMFAELKFYGTIMIFSLAFAQSAVLLRLNTGSALVNSIRMTALVAIGTVTAILLVMVFASDLGGELIIRFTAFAAIVSFFATIITLFMHEATKFRLNAMIQEPGHQEYETELPDSE